MNVICVPIHEELLFRGLLLRAIELSRLGAVGAVVITGVLFAAIHHVGSPLAAVHFLGLGILFGAARWRTNSPVTSWALHTVANAIAVGDAKAIR